MYSNTLRCQVESSLAQFVAQKALNCKQDGSVWPAASPFANCDGLNNLEIKTILPLSV
jgi:hypothetical protein